MKQIKKHIKRLHKIKVHHNRWFIWTIVLSSMILFSLVYYIKISELLFEHSLSSSEFSGQQGSQYRDPYLGFSIRHPTDWGIESADRNIVEFNNPYASEEGFTVGLYDFEDFSAIKNSLDVLREQDVTVANQSATLLILNPSAKDNATRAILVAKDDRLYLIKGNTPKFNGIVNSFILIPTVDN